MVQIAWIEDDIEVLNYYKPLFEANGFALHFYDDFDSLIEAETPNKAELIISELIVDGEPAVDYIEEIRKHPDYVSTAVFIVSDICNQNHIATALGSGCDDYLLKPVPAELLIGKIQYYLKEGHLFITNMLMHKDFIFANRYKIIQSIGSGGSSTVYKAVDLKTEQIVALKIMNISHSSKNDKSGHFFLREVYVHSKISHQNIVELIDFGYHDSLCYMVMEYLEGQTLRETNDSEPLAPDFVANITLAVIDVIEYLDRQDLVHRDIKPSNIILTNDGEIKLLDFGLSKGQYDATVSNQQNINGTPQFVSPEQIIGSNNLDVKSDIYSLGITIYYLLTGKFPFYGDSLVATLSKHLSGTPEKLDTLLPELNAKIVNLIHNMISREKRKRPKPKDIKTAFLSFLEEFKGASA